MKTINFINFAMDFVGVAVDFLSSFVAAVWRIFKTSVAAVWRVRGAKTMENVDYFEKRKAKTLENVERNAPRTRQMRATGTSRNSKRLWLQFGASEVRFARRFPLF